MLRHVFAGTVARACSAWLAVGVLVPLGAQPLPRVQIVDGMVTVDAREAPVRALLEAIARETGLVLEGAEWLTGTITVSFERQPLEEAVPLVLGDRSYALAFEHRGAAAPRPARLRLFESPAPPDPAGDEAASPGPADRETLFDQLENGAEPVDRMDAIDALIDRAEPEAARRIGLAALRDPDDGVRRAAIAALALLGGNSAVEQLEPVLADPVGDIREAAVDALGQIGTDRAARGLTAALRDDSDEIRLLAIDALGAIGGATAIQLLEYVRAADEDADLRAAADDWLADLRR